MAVVAHVETSGFTVAEFCVEVEGVWVMAGW